MSLTALAQQETGAAKAPTTAGGQFKEILAYIPTEMVTLYVSLTSLVNASAVSNKHVWTLWISIVCLIGSAVWVIVANAQSSTKAPVAPLYYRVIAAVVAFAVWAYVLGYAINPGFKSTAEYSLSAGLLLVAVPFALSYFGRAFNSKAPPRREHVKYLPTLRRRAA